MNLQIEGYTIFLLECADGSYYSGMCKNLEKKLLNIEHRLSEYFSHRPDLLPVRVIYREDHVPFKEAFAKHRSLRAMSRQSRKRFLRTKKWPLSKQLKKIIEKVG